MPVVAVSEDAGAVVLVSLACLRRSTPKSSRGSLSTVTVFVPSFARPFLVSRI